MNIEKENGEIKQIIVITDGKSNIGINPIEAAKNANLQGILVSTIALIDGDNSGSEKDIEEVEGIAKAGGGLCEYTQIQDLSKTIKQMTQKTAQKTIEQIVSKQLKTIVGVDINNLEPTSRFKIVEFIEKYGDSINIKCVIVLDTSGSMKNKLEKAKKSMYELLQDMKCRKGKSSISVVKYPGIKNELCSIVCHFTQEPEILRDKIIGIKASGGTPTGPAIELACKVLQNFILENQEDLVEEEIQRYYV